MPRAQDLPDVHSNSTEPKNGLPENTRLRADPHVYDGKKITRVKTKLKPELQDAWRVDHADGVLWSIGVKDLARFDGKRWERIHDPDNEKIGK